MEIIINNVLFKDNCRGALQCAPTVIICMHLLQKLGQVMLTPLQFIRNLAIEQNNNLYNTKLEIKGYVL